jgi:Xaa-Pro dipeptidase
VTTKQWKIEKELAFPVEEYQSRLDALRKRMGERGIDVLLVSAPENMCYLSGFNTPGYYFPQAMIVALDRPPLIAMRSLEGRNVEAYCWLDVSQRRVFQDNEEPMKVIAAAVVELGGEKGRIGVDLRAWYLTVSDYRKLEAALPNARFTDAFGIVERGRECKSAREIDYIRRACAISNAAMRTAVEGCRKGPVTEEALAGDVHRTLVASGGEYTGLPLFLSSGHRTLLPHAVWSNKQIVNGDNVFVELTGVVQRYAGPLFRTILIGKPSDVFADRAKVCEDMLAGVIEAIRPGATSNEVNDAAVRAAKRIGGGIIKRAGYSVGLNFPPDWGEGFFLDLKSGDRRILEPGMVFHVPQTVRMPDEMPVAISETVMVTERGREVLTNFPRNLIVIDH